MRALRRWMDTVRPWFAPGGRWEKLHPIFEAADAFLFTPPDVSPGPPHIRDAVDLKRWMVAVIVALMPCLLFGIYNAGRQYHLANGIPDAGFWAHWLRGAWIVLPIVLVSYAVGGCWEVLFAVVRKHEINEGFLVTGLLFPLVLPPSIPLWQVAAGISFGVVIGKEVFGGTGFNVLNPALAGRAFLFFSYARDMTGDRVWSVLADRAGAAAEGFTGATPLAVAAAVPKGADVFSALREAGYTLRSMALGFEGGSIGETSLIPIAMGALILILTGVGSWRIMAGGGIGLAATVSLFNAFAGEGVSPYQALPWTYHLAMGSVAFGLVFMATDPVSAAATTTGKWIYGFLVGALVALVRIANPAFPEGVMVSILFMNVMAPLVDYFVVQGHIRARARYLRSFPRA